MKLQVHSRADLLRELARGTLNGRTAGFYGFRDTSQPDEPPPAPPDAAPDFHREPDQHPPPERAPSSPPAFPDKRPPLKFVRAVSSEWLGTLPPPPVGNPISETELAVNWPASGLPLRPLVRWPRLAVWARQRLGAEVMGAALDFPRLMKHVARGRPVLSLPRRWRRVWAQQAVILWDDTKEMRPFASDLRWLKARLIRERGRQGLHIVEVSELPGPRLLGHMPPGAPVLALSAMGQLEGCAATQAAWAALARQLRWRGHSIQALVPCPRRLWSAAIADAWPLALWDWGARLPRQSGLQPVPPVEKNATVSLLLDHLSPAHRISPALLRAARLSLPERADIGVEWSAWHEAGWHSRDACGFHPGAVLDARLHSRKAFTGANADAAARIGALMLADQRATLSRVFAWEVELRALMTGGSTLKLEDVTGFLEKVRDRLRRSVAARAPVTRGTRIGDLSRWVREMAERFTPEIRATAEVSGLLARSLALADSLLDEAHSRVPSGIDEAAYREEMRLVPQLVAEPHQLKLALCSSGLVAFDAAAPLEHRTIPLADMHASSGAVTLGGERYAFQSGASVLQSWPRRVRSPVVQSSHQRMEIESFARPAWASRLWYDRHGLAAEFRIRSVPFILRWIPPGSFLMGSPEDEPGRQQNEGPRHEVRISRGFWMGETPVTQEQWRAVVEAAEAMPGIFNRLLGVKVLDAAPSRFKGPVELPVEQVSWKDSETFCRLLDGIMPDGPGFRLPTEAQWEFACRAGSQTALYSGPIDILGANNAPALDPIAWYGGNSGLDLEVANAYDSSPWPDKQHAHSKAGTHRVRLKDPNALGLHDMLGNVWEWCRDAWDENVYRQRATGVSDPFVRKAESAFRVVRGGSWFYQARFCRAAIRFGFGPGFRFDFLGLRLSAGQEPGAAEPPLPERRSRARRAAGNESA